MMNITETVLKFVPHLQFLVLLHMIVAKHWVEGYCISNHRAILFHVFLELWAAFLNDKNPTIKFNLLEWSTLVILQKIFTKNTEFYQMYAECFYCIWWVQTLIWTWMNFARFLIQSWVFFPLFAVLISSIFWKSAKRSNENLKDIKQNKANFNLFFEFWALKQYH